MNVLSLFDGVGCGHVALDKAGIYVDKYYASEIDKYAISVTQRNYPDTIQLGSVLDYDSWDIEKPDIILAGFPCQPYSVAGYRKGVEDHRGGDIIEAMFSVIDTYKPPVILLENVKGLLSIDNGNVFASIIDALKDMGYFVNWSIINSALVSAQNRERVYIVATLGTPVIITQPEDRGIYLKDIIIDAITEKDKSYCIDANYWKGASVEQYKLKCRRQLVQRKDSACLQVGEADIRGMECIKRVYDIAGKCPTLTTMGGGHREPKITTDYETWRKLTPLECERLQTLPDGYTAEGCTGEKISNTQRYRCLGNGWTVDVIVHILRCIYEQRT